MKKMMMVILHYNMLLYMLLIHKMLVFYMLYPQSAGFKEVAKLLIENGADVNVQDNEGGHFCTLDVIILFQSLNY